MSDPFTPGEEMPMWEFEKRYTEKICGGVLPQWAQARVRVVSVQAGAVTIAIRAKPQRAETPSQSPPCQGGDEEGVPQPKG